MKTTIHRFTNQSWSKPYGVITEAETYTMTLEEIWKDKNIVGYVDKPRGKQKFTVKYKGKTLGTVWHFGEARDLIEKEINGTCYLSQAD
jgi:hypothetical protein